MTNGQILTPNVSEPVSDLELTDQRLSVVSNTDRVFRKDVARVTTNLANCFRQFLAMQEQLGRQLVDLEDTFDQQRDELSQGMRELPEMKQKVNWLIASFYDQGKKDQDVRDRLDRLEAGMASLSDMMRKMCESQAQWRSSMDQVVEILVRARTSAAAQ